MARRGNEDVPLSTGKANSLVCVPGGGYTTWTIEPRGDAYVSAFSTYCLSILFAYSSKQDRKCSRCHGYPSHTGSSKCKSAYVQVVYFRLKLFSIYIGLAFASRCRSIVD